MLESDNLYSLLQKSATRYSYKTAVTDLKDKEITYEDLEKNSSEICSLLKENNIDSGSRVGILASKSIEYITFIFGILKANAAYIPLDCSSPITRNSYICNDCDVQGVFIENSFFDAFVEANTNQNSFKKIEICADFSLLIFQKIKPKRIEHIAYILYTSGSTGIPKGVVHTHQSAFSFIEWSMNTFQTNQNDKFLSQAPFHFDLSIFDIFVSIGSGSTVVLANEKQAANPMQIASSLANKKITIFYATPSTLSYLYLFGKMEKYKYNDLRLLLFAGEEFSITNLKQIKSIFTKSCFYNLYGPTETNVCTWYKIPQDISEEQTKPFPIGKQCSFAELRIGNVDKQGEEGELYVAGNSIMLCYWGDKEKTNNALEVDTQGKCWYKTGDIVKLDAERNYIYLGRKDRMIKRKGYRIELAEIEHALSQNTNIWQVAVVAIPKHETAEAIITAHVSLTKDKKISVIDLIQYSSKVLPAYMVPDKFIIHTILPKTATNKINYQLLNQLHD